MITCFRSLIICLLFVLPGTQPFAEDAPGTILISSEEYPPYTSENLKDYGIDAAIVTAAFRLEGINTQYVIYTSARSYQMARLGKVDATLPWAIREGREKDFYYSDPVIKVEVEHFYSLKNAPFDWDPGNPDMVRVRGNKVATITGHNYGEIFQDAEKRGLIKTKRLDTLSQGFSMLLAGRVNAVITKKHVADRVLAEQFTIESRAKLVSVPVSQAVPTYDYLLFSRQSVYGEYFLKAFNKGLKKLHDSGGYLQLIDDLARSVYTK
jgi:polar amino acid transport system substrate-binding protein